MCIGGVTLAFCLICAAVLLDARRDATAQAATEARNIAQSVAQDVARNLELYDLSLQAVVQGLQYPGLAKLDPELRQLILFNRATKAPYFSFINAIDETGAVIANSQSPTPRGGNWANRDYFIAQRSADRDRQFIGRPFFTGPGQPATITISRRMTHPDGSFAGVVVGTMRLAYFRDLLSRLTVGPHATIELLRADGMILMRLPFNADDIGRTLPQNALFFRAPGGGAVDGEDPTDHQRRRFLFERIDDLPLVVGVGLADADIYAAWRNKAEAIGGVVAVLAAINLLLLLVVRYALARRELGLAALRHGDAQRATLVAQREKAVAVAAQTAAVKTRFLATMSHELRTPLNSILGYAELLSIDGHLEPVQAARIAAMRSAGDHLRDVVNRMLDFSRVEAEDQPAPSVRTDLAALMEQCRAIVEPMAAAKGLTLTCSMAPAAPRDVLADAGSIRQILLNLLGNAVKFTEQGAVTLRITRGASGTRFVVTDTGIGVPAIQRDRLFQPYERLDADRIGVPGTGLGLAIAARLVARMRGRIGHEANPSGGSVFWAELPLPGRRHRGIDGTCCAGHLANAPVAHPGGRQFSDESRRGGGLPASRRPCGGGGSRWRRGLAHGCGPGLRRRPDGSAHARARWCRGDAAHPRPARPKRPDPDYCRDGRRAGGSRRGVAGGRLPGLVDQADRSPVFAGGGRHRDGRSCPGNGGMGSASDGRSNRATRGDAHPRHAHGHAPTGNAPTGNAHAGHAHAGNADAGHAHAGRADAGHTTPGQATPGHAIPGPAIPGPASPGHDAIREHRAGDGPTSSGDIRGTACLPAGPAGQCVLRPIARRFSRRFSRLIRRLALGLAARRVPSVAAGIVPR